MFERVRGHERAKRRLEDEVRRDKLAYAYLFVGPDGVGKKLCAMEFARGIVCPHAVEKEHSCGVCERVMRGVHPDVLLFRRLEDKQEISIDQIRVLQEIITLKPFECERRVFIVDEAHLLSASASNCFLKTLEEPPEEAVIILVASETEALPFTVVSRCRAVRFGYLDLRTSVGILEELGEADSEKLACFANGSISRAIALKELLDRVPEEEIVGLCTGLDFEESLTLASELLERFETSDREERRKSAELLIDLLLLAYRDAIALRLGAQASFWKGYEEELSELAPSVHALETKAHFLLEAGEAIRYNTNVELTVEEVVVKLSL